MLNRLPNRSARGLFVARWAAVVVLCVTLVTIEHAPIVAATAPAPPRAFLDTTPIAPTGQTIVVPDGGDFQAALDDAQPGDLITLEAGATYTGSFILPAKSVGRC